MSWENIDDYDENIDDIDDRRKPSNKTSKKAKVNVFDNVNDIIIANLRLGKIFTTNWPV